MEEERYLLDELIEKTYREWKDAPAGSEQREKLAVEFEKFYNLRTKEYQAQQTAENEKERNEAMVEIEKAKMKLGIKDVVVDILKIVVPSAVTVFLTGGVMEFEREGVLKSGVWRWLSKKL